MLAAAGHDGAVYHPPHVVATPRARSSGGGGVVGVGGAGGYTTAPPPMDRTPPPSFHPSADEFDRVLLNARTARRVTTCASRPRVTTGGGGGGGGGVPSSRSPLMQAGSHGGAAHDATWGEAVEWYAAASRHAVGRMRVHGEHGGGVNPGRLGGDGESLGHTGPSSAARGAGVVASSPAAPAAAGNDQILRLLVLALRRRALQQERLSKELRASVHRG